MTDPTPKPTFEELLRKLLSESVGRGITNATYEALLAAHADVVGELKEFRWQLSMAQSNNHARNVALDALHFVWCDGGCSSGVHRYGEHPPLTAEIVAAAKLNSKRLERWFINAAGHAVEATVEARQPVWNQAQVDVHNAELDALKAELEKAQGELKEARKAIRNARSGVPWDGDDDYGYQCIFCGAETKTYNEREDSHEPDCIWTRCAEVNNLKEDE